MHCTSMGHSYVPSFLHRNSAMVLAAFGFYHFQIRIEGMEDSLLTFLAAYLIHMTWPHQLKMLKKYNLQQRGGHRAVSAKEGIALQK